MSLSLGVLSFGVEADTSKLDKGIQKSEEKINRFSISGVQKLNYLNSFNISKAENQIDSYNNKLDKLKYQSQITINEIEELEDKMNKIKDRIAETSGLNLKFETSQNTGNRMTTQEYHSNLDKLALEDKEYQKILNKQIKLTEKSEQQGIAIDGINSKLVETNSKIESARKVQGFENNIKNIDTGIKRVSSGIGTTIIKTLKWGATLLGIGSAVGLIRKGVNSLIKSNPQIQANLDYMVYSLGQLLAPAVQWVINLFSNLLGIVGAVFQVFFGINIFASSFSKYMAQANKNANATKKALGSLAGFDEINNIGTNDTNTGGANFTAPSFNLDNKVNEWIPTIQKIKDIFENCKDIVKAIGIGLASWGVTSTLLNFFNKLFDWNLTNGQILLKGLGVGLTLGGAYLTYKGMTKILNGELTAESILELIAGNVSLAAGILTLSGGNIKVALGATLAFNSFLVSYNGASGILNGDITWANVFKIIGGSIGTGLGILLMTGSLVLGGLGIILSLSASFAFASLPSFDEIKQSFVTIRDSIVDWWNNSTTWEKFLGIGKYIILGILTGMAIAILGIPGFIASLFVVFITAIADAFGIASPAKKMEPYGEYIILGLLKGITNLFINVTTVFSNLKNQVTLKLSEMVTSASEKGEGIKNKLTTAFNGAKTNALNTFENIKNGIGNKLESAKNTVSSQLSRIKSLFNFSWSLPHLKTPHISWDSAPASGWIASTLSALGLPTNVPKMNISWYEDGGVFGKDSVIGVGEYVNAGSNPEVVAPKKLIYQTAVDANRKVASESKISKTDNQKPLYLTVQLGQKTIFDDMIDYANEKTRQNGVSVFVEE